ncbi:hypothetical protein RUS47_02210 [Mycoplasmoides gallisepticum]|uniref:hypothetical protein n=1 Tax=Mycoplasmoides gallisepticum TaxID=2096 RepID=UPI0012451B71|nr:hypothetical protein [Mycoplasmoides gallisepticum]QEX47331.1 hypothetical protein F6J63_02220 [Mycoplasmoides gallisepticum]ULH61936.1 hypothetical protein MHC98_02250 [Mycoplasmoides gallisepticum]ULH67280.1 hypothetical protein MHC97_02240 [Mycoplasmoides gallisepticum]ULH68005.1 hypothetical protein MHC99_02250 [Mycoplasmoides gallisepticum]WGG23601.1 hypothetical protein P0D30_02270 [Mycoplasmoides gallisepticum]
MAPNNKKIDLITARELEKISFKYNNEGEYDSQEVDKILDCVIDSLKFYENQVKRLDQYEQHVKMLQDDIERLKQINGDQRVQIKEMSDNGYDRVAFMNKTTQLEKSLMSLSAIASQVTRMENMVSRIFSEVDMIKKILSHQQ